MEGVGADVGRVLEKAQKLSGTGVKDDLLRAGDLAPRAGQLHDGQSGLFGEGQRVSGGLAGVGDEVAEDIILILGGHGQLAPLLTGEEEGGVQYHPGLPAGDGAHQILTSLFPDGEGVKGGQILAELLVIGGGQSRGAQTGGVGDAAALADEVQQEGRLELLVGVDIRVPDLVAARDVHVVVGGIVPELGKGGVPLGAELHLLIDEGFKAVKAGLEGAVVEGGVGIGGGVPHRAGVLEKLVGGGGVGEPEVDDVAVVAQTLDGAHGGVGLELRAVVVGEMEGDKTGPGHRSDAS